MQIYTSLDAIQEQARGAVIAIGNFDGVHKGHQNLIARAKAKADALNAPLAVLTFTPHPRAVFKPDQAPFALTSEEQKAVLLQNLCDVDILFNLTFDKAFAALPAQNFITDILIQALGAKHIVVGHDFCFGDMRSGNAETLAACTDFTTEIVGAISHDEGTIYSSSEIRNALRRGDMARASDLLGWRWTIQSDVIHGDKRGRELGYPTANMRLGDYICPAMGVYASRVKLPNSEKWHMAATNIGIRPMFQSKQPLVETFIFDFDQDIYGQSVTVQPVQFLRGEAKFETLDALTTQMAKDCAQARKILS